MRGILLALPVAAALAALVACAGPGTRTGPTGTPRPPTPPSSPTEEVAPSPDREKSPLSIRPDFTRTRPAVVWDNVEGEIEYEVEGRVTWYPRCGTDAEPKTLSFDDSLPRDKTRYELPVPLFGDLSVLKDYDIVVRAVGAYGTFTQEASGFIGEPFCPSD